MEKYSNMHGFTLVRTTDCPEQSATLVEYVHDGTGAPLFYLDRPDENMTFAIGFRTVPTDDTGVFHILEHSVLCGSKKFPVKDPFSELLKGSVSTFLNAFTYGERTVYPVSSLNKKAFLDLVNVYLDAVLHPLALENEYIFMQEGHRLEFSEDGTLCRNGIVYNEMRGAYSTPDEIAAYYEGRLMFEGGCYGFDSGGNPDAIPTLSFEEFKRAHAKYYHPSNSILFLDGTVELDKTLSLINSYLSEYEKSECYPDIPEGKPTEAKKVEIEYPVATEEEEDDSTRVILLQRFGSHTDRANFLSVSLAAESLSDGNSSPLKKAILDTGMCKNFAFYPIAGMKYPVFVTRFIDVCDGCEETLVAFYRQTLARLLDGELDSKKIAASLNCSEFQTREADFGSYPRGMVYMSSVMEDVVCGDYPTLGLNYNDLFTFLRSKLDTPHYINALRDVFAKDGERMLVLRPSASLDAKRANRDAENMTTLLSTLPKAEIERIKTGLEGFETWQTTPDTDDAIASIPTLEISDLEPPSNETPTVIKSVKGVEVISHPIPTSGITYLDLFFDVSDLDVDGITALSAMALTASDFDTNARTAEEMRTEIKTWLGNLAIKVSPFKKDGRPRLYLQLSLSTLAENKLRALSLIPEVLYTRKYKDKDVLKRRIRQIITYAREALPSTAPGTCLGIGAAAFDEFEAVKELMGGITCLSALNTIEVENREEELLCGFRDITEKYLTRSRLCVAITGEYDPDFIEMVINSITDGGSVAGECIIEKFPREDIGISIASQVSFATLVTNFHTAGDGKYHGAMMTLGTILDYELLWNEIRVKGGAYGTSFICRGNSGTLGYYSFRDPIPENSLSVFRSVPDMVRDFVSESPDLTRYIIGTVGSLESVSTPRGAGEIATVHYLSGKTREDILARREESLHTTAQDLLSVADTIERATASAVAIVAGPREKLLSCGLKRIIEL